MVTCDSNRMNTFSRGDLSLAAEKSHTRGGAKKSRIAVKLPESSQTGGRLGCWFTAWSKGVALQFSRQTAGPNLKFTPLSQRAFSEPVQE